MKIWAGEREKEGQKNEGRKGGESIGSKEGKKGEPGRIYLDRCTNNVDRK